MACEAEDRRLLLIETYDYKASEDEKYSWLYKNGYGVGPVRRTVKFAKGVIPAGALTMLDCGCGRGTLADELTGYKSYTGIDLASSVIEQNRAEHPDRTFTHGCLTEMTYCRAFDVAWCIDVLEHLPPDVIPLALPRLFAAARWQVISVCCTPSKTLSKEGENLHLTIWSPQRWKREFKKHGVILKEMRRGSTYVAVCQPRSSRTDNALKPGRASS